MVLYRGRLKQVKPVKLEYTDSVFGYIPKCIDDIVPKVTVGVSPPRNPG